MEFTSKSPDALQQAALGDGDLVGYAVIGRVLAMLLFGDAAVVQVAVEAAAEGFFVSEGACGAGLLVHVNEHSSDSAPCEPSREVYGGGCLADSALLVSDCENFSCHNAFIVCCDSLFGQKIKWSNFLRLQDKS